MGSSSHLLRAGELFLSKAGSFLPGTLGYLRVSNSSALGRQREAGGLGWGSWERDETQAAEHRC